MTNSDVEEELDIMNLDEDALAKMSPETRAVYVYYLFSTDLLSVSSFIAFQFMLRQFSFILLCLNFYAYFYLYFLA